MSADDPVRSPLTGGETYVEGILSTDDIIELYRTSYDVDVSRFFMGIPKLERRRCLDSGYAFFWPAISGDKEFYAELAEFDWFYKKDKWEYQRALSFVSPRDQVLDVGAGYGHFLTKVVDRGALASGLEFSSAAVDHARQAGLKVEAVSIEDHAATAPGAYSVVTSFQVLEHVADPKSFIGACVAALKPGGLMMLAVPNDGGFVGIDDTAPLNRPPHHLSLWDERSLSSLEKLFDLELQALEYEPLQEINWFVSVMVKKYMPGGWKGKLLNRLGAQQLVTRAVTENSHFIRGHSVMAVFRKIQ